MSGEILQDFSCEFIHESDSCKLVDFLVDENAKLREERDGWKKLCTDQEVMHVMREETLDNENAKLRELVRDYEHCTVHADCSSCKYDGTTSTHCPFSPCFPDIDELRELGVEVTDG